MEIDDWNGGPGPISAHLSCTCCGGQIGELWSYFMSTLIVVAQSQASLAYHLEAALVKASRFFWSSLCRCGQALGLNIPNRTLLGASEACGDGEPVNFPLD